jgi:integrase/recombinase XerD
VSALAPTLEAFFTERLIGQRQASPHTIASYRDALCLLLAYMAESSGKSPAQLDFGDLDAPTIGGFLIHLERDRGVGAATRNARLAAVRSLFAFAAYRHPEHAALIARVLSIPAKRKSRPLVVFLDPPEIDALLAAPDSDSWTGRRDHALLTFGVQTGLRVSELAGVRHVDVAFAHGAHVRVYGKGRKERVTPLTSHTVAVLGSWLDERAGEPDDPLFPGPTGRPLGRDAIRKLVVKHAHAAATHCESLASKQIGVHTLRHSCAMALLRSGVDLATIALWLGHEDLRTVQCYLHADLALKERAISRVAPPNTKPGRYQPPDALLRFLAAL